MWQKMSPKFAVSVNIISQCFSEILRRQTKSPLHSRRLCMHHALRSMLYEISIILQMFWFTQLIRRQNRINSVFELCCNVADIRSGSSNFRITFGEIGRIIWNSSRKKQLSSVSSSLKGAFNYFISLSLALKRRRAVTKDSKLFIAFSAASVVLRKVACLQHANKLKLNRSRRGTPTRQGKENN